MAGTLPPVIAVLTADGSDFSDAIDDAIAKLEEFKAAAAGTDDATLGVDDTDANEKIDELEAKLDEFGVKTDTATAEVDDTDAGAKIDVLDAKLDEFGLKHDTATADVNTDAGREGVDSLIADSEEISPAFAEAGAESGEGFSEALLPVLAGLAPALIPIGAALAGVLGGFLPILAGAGIAVGAFVLAASGSMKTVEAEAEKMLTAWQTAMAPIVTPVLQQAVALIGPALQAVTPFVSAAAAAFKTLLTQAGDALQSPFWQNFFTFLSQVAGPALVVLGGFVGSLGKMFAGLMEAFAPMIPVLEGGLTKIGTAMAGWATGLANSKSFQSFIDYIKTNGPEVGKVLGDLFIAFGHILTDLAPLGPAVLQVVDALSKFFIAASPLIAVLAGVFGEVSSLVLKLDELALPTIAQGFEDVAKGVQDVAQWIGQINWSHVGSDIVNVFTGIPGDIKNALGEVGEDIMAFLAVIGAAFTTAWTSIENTVESVVNSITAFLTAAWDTIKGGVVTGWDAISDFFTTAWATITSIVTSAISTVENVLLSGWSLITGAVTSAWSTIQSLITSAWSSITSIVSSAAGTVASVMSSAWSTVQSITSSAWDAIRSAITTAWSAITSAVSSAVGGVKSVMSDAWLAISTGATDAWNDVRNAVAGIVNDFLGMVSPIVNGAADAFGWIPIIGGNLKSAASAFDSFKAEVVADIAAIPSSKTFTLVVNSASALAAIRSIASQAGAAAGAANNAFAAGGIVNQPTIALVGEAGPEAILPLNDLSRSAQILGQTGLPGISPLNIGGSSSYGGGNTSGQQISISMPITIQGNADTATALAIQQAVATEFTVFARQLALVS